MRAWLLPPALVAAALSADARADWEVRRGGDAALIEGAVRALQSRPDAPGLAERVVRLAGKAKLEPIVERLRLRASREPQRYEALEAHAQLLLAAERGEEAALAFTAALAIRPTAQAAAGLAYALARTERLDEALAAFDAALARERRRPERLSLLRAMRGVAERANAIERLVAVLKEMVELAPNDSRALREAAAALVRSGRPAEAAALVERAARASKPDRERVGLLLEAAALREQAKQDDLAEGSLRQALSASREETDRREVYGKLVAVARRRDTLLELHQQLERVTGGAGRAADWEALARVREELGDWAGAVEAHRRRVALDRADLQARRGLVALLERLGREDELQQEFAEIERQWPNDPDLTIERIERKLRRGERDDGRALLDRALRSQRRNADALARLADVASRFGEDERVLAAWDAVLALSPRDERAIVGLGEAHFQAGRREVARRTWRALLGAVRPRAAAHARLAEILGEHEMLDEAVGEARTALKLDPDNSRHRRTLARILERKREHAAAMAEWRVVLQQSVGPDRAGERREARSALTNLLLREGRMRLEAEATKLKESLKKDEGDLENTTFLAEIQMRLMAVDGAIETLRRGADRWPASPEIVTPLVRLLRQSRQLAEAVSRLERLAEAAPARARDAFIQIADLELERYDDPRALAFAAKAAALADNDAEALARIGDIEERAGQRERALATYRRALAAGPSARAAAAVARLLVRGGDAAAASRILRALGEEAADDEIRAEAIARNLEISEFLGAPSGFERAALGMADQGGAAWRKLALSIVGRIAPGLYERAATDASAAAELRRMSRWGLRPLLELATALDGAIDPRAIFLIGLLGNQNATPVLLDLLRTPVRGERSRGTGANTAAGAATSVQVEAAIALGRLEAAEAVAPLIASAGAPDAALRAAAIWALGRLGDPRAAPALEAAASDVRPEVAALACIGLGRVAPRTALLTRIATDPGRPVRARRGAVVGLGLGGAAASAPLLLPLLDAPDRDLAQAAALTLGTLRDRQVLPALLDRALLGDGPAAEAARLALRGFAAPAARPADEARAMRQPGMDVDLVLETMSTPPLTDGVLGPLWLEHAADVEELLTRALADAPDRRRRALAALEEVAGADPERARAAERRPVLGAKVRERVAGLLDDSDALTRLLALRVMIHLEPVRIGPSHLQAALTTALVTPDPGFGPDPAETALAAARAFARSHRTGATSLVDAIRPLLVSGPWQGRWLAVRVLRLAGAAAHEPLLQALADASAFVRAEATEALAAAPQASPALVRAASDPVAAVRAAAARGLRHRSDPAARAAMRRLSADENPVVRAAARGAPPVREGSGHTYTSPTP